MARREEFRRAFAGFDPDAVAAFTDADIQRLLADPTIIRHEGKCRAAVANAVATVGLRPKGGLVNVVWDAVPREVSVPLTQITQQSEWSARLAEELTDAGFTRLGAVTAQSLLVASGALRVVAVS